MNLMHAIVNVQTARYDGPAVVVCVHDDDTVTVREAQIGHELRVAKAACTVASVTEQSAGWVAQELLAAWQPWLTRLARHLAEQLQSYGCFGASEEADSRFRTYLAEPSRAFRSLCRGRSDDG